MKDFDKWNIQKKKIHSRFLKTLNVVNSEISEVYVHEREVWWCALGKNIGYEQDGSGEFFLRPVVILKKFGSNTCLVVPFSTTTRKAWYRHDLVLDNENIKALITQFKVIDMNRLVEKHSVLDKIQFKKLKNKITEIIQ